jgi:hypothetical protein
MNTQIIENNKLLAEFMGNDTDEYGADVFVPKQLMFNHNAQCMQGIFQFDECYFDTDWSWLMQVVEKIENYNEFTNVLFAPQGCAIDVYIENGFAFSNDCDTKIEAVYNACIEFVKWYNNQNK